MRVNILCLTGAIVALACLALPWGTVTNHEHLGDWEHTSTTEYRLTDPVNFEGDAHLTSIFEIVVLGGIISIFTSLGGFVQVLGVMSYYDHMGHYLEGMSVPTYWITAHFSLGAGFYLAVFAAIVTLLSVLFPFGIRGSGIYNPLSGEKPTMLQRLLVWGWK